MAKEPNVWKHVWNFNKDIGRDEFYEDEEKKALSHDTVEIDTTALMVLFQRHY
jgi:hypothetical protein